MEVYPPTLAKLPMLTKGIALGANPFPPITPQSTNHVALEPFCLNTFAINPVGCGIIKVINPVSMSLMNQVVQLNLMVFTDPVGSKIIIVAVQFSKGNTFIIR